MDIGEFLLARIAEDEAVARAAAISAPGEGHWGRPVKHDQWDYTAVREDVIAFHDGYGIPLWQTANHIAQWDPARVLAECEAKRAIVEVWQLVAAQVRAVALSNQDEARDARNMRSGLQIALEALALPYADHPDYQSEWSLTASVV